MLSVTTEVPDQRHRAAIGRPFGLAHVMPANAPLLLVLLPGMDGTGILFALFVAELPANVRPIVMAYPPTEALGYAELLAWLLPRLPPGPFVVLGESFSGPLALAVAASAPDRVMGVILAASFSESPIPRFLRWFLSVVSGLVFLIPPPRFAVRGLLAGLDAPSALVDQTRAAVRSVSPHVLAKRLGEIVRLAASPPCSVPILDISGRRDLMVASAARRSLAARSSVTLDAPHLVLQREPRAAAEAVERFLVEQGLLARR